MSVVVETFHPWLTGPSRFALGTTTSVKKTSLKWWCPVIRTSGRTVMPGVVIGTSRQLIPWCFGTSGFVRTSRMIQWAKCAPDVHRLLPHAAALEGLAIGRDAVVGRVVQAELGRQVGGQPAAKFFAKALVLGGELEIHGAASRG